MNRVEKTERPVLQFLSSRQVPSPWLLSFCLLTFLGCFVLIGLAAQRVMKPLQHYVLPLSANFMRLGSWLLGPRLPTTPYPSSVSSTTPSAAAYIEMFLFIALAFTVYAGMSLLIWRYASVGRRRVATMFIWLGALLAGLLLVSTPVLLSQDLFVYADYGHVMVAYGANPFFVSPLAVSHDTITSIDNWSFATSAYGPVWMYICALVALVAGDHPGRYYVIFRLLAFACYLLNILLVGAILRLAGGSLRIRAIGMLLYAWNPLVLLESCLGAHNDVALNTCVLLAIFLVLRMERKDFVRLRNYWAPLLACGIAVLIKFTLLPLVALFLLLLLRRTFEEQRGGMRVRWWATLSNVCLAGALFVALSLACYLPLWFGHSLPEIVKSFSTPPSALWAENSFLRSLQDWLKVHGYPASGSVLYAVTSVVSQRVFWDRASAGALACTLLVGAFFIWRSPSVQRMVLVLLIALCVLLVVTPWFYPWYVQWILVLGVTILAAPLGWLEKALLAFVLTFSASALLTYLDPVFTPLGRALDTRVFFVVGLPVLVFLVTFRLVGVWRRAVPSAREDGDGVDDAVIARSNAPAR